MARDLREAAMMRNCQIRRLKGIPANLIEDPKDREAFQAIIDRQLMSMGAETLTEWRQRIDKAYEEGRHISFKEYETTAKPYKMQPEDLKRYVHW